jgi:hypothetical protein
VYISTNNGSSWTEANNGLTNFYIAAFAVDGNKVYAGTGAGVFVTTNNGSSWTALNAGFSSFSIHSIAAAGNDIFAGTYHNGLYYSSNGGLSWTAVNSGLPGTGIGALALSGIHVIAGLDTFGVFLSTNLGQNWVPKNEGFVTGGYCHALYIADGYIYLGVSNGAWRRPLGEITAAAISNYEIPDGFHLHQNYPNPFNPVTKIRFDISASPLNERGDEGGFVTLVIYDPLGREVATLVDEQLKPGSYEVEWSATGGASNYPSGVYFYKLTAGDFTDTKKLILIK